MGAVTVPANARVWSALVMAFIVAMLGASPAVLDFSAAGPADHHITETGDFDQLVAVDHDHIGPSAIQNAADDVADALLHRARIALTALGLVFVVGLLWQVSREPVSRVGRDPPGTQLIFSAGRDVLARLCISRR